MLEQNIENSLSRRGDTKEIKIIVNLARFASLHCCIVIVQSNLNGFITHPLWWHNDHSAFPLSAHLNNLLRFPGIKHPPSHWIPYQKELVFFGNECFPNISKQPTVRFIRCRNWLDCCLSVEFTESGNMAVRSNSAVSENLRIREFKECVSARPHLRKRGIHKCFSQRLLKFPLAENLSFPIRKTAV